jgi:hypothetical protein
MRKDKEYAFNFHCCKKIYKINKGYTYDTQNYKNQ